MRWDGSIVGGIVALPKVSGATLQACGRCDRVCSYLDYGDNKASYIVELAHVHSKVLELVLLGFFEDKLGALPHSIDAAQIAYGVKSWVGCFGEGNIWETRGPGAVGGGARGAQGAIGGVWLAAAGGDDGLGAFAVE